MNRSNQKTDMREYGQTKDDRQRGGDGNGTTKRQLRWRARMATMTATDDDD